MPKLLIVDDETDITQFAKHFFEKRGIEVVTASSGQEALDLVNLSKPDLALLDVHMGEITGVDVLRKIRESGNAMKVIMVTGAEDPAIVQQTQELGVSGFIRKPLALDELEKVVMKELKS